jgi:hypothetical protein
MSSYLGIENFDSWVRNLSVVEACTAVKPYALKILLNDYKTATYLDPDIYIYSPLDEIFSKPTDDWSILLTPHQLQPATQDWLTKSTELESLRFGVFNLGFLSVNNTQEGKRIAQWWCDRCYDYCKSLPERGLFTDQKFFDMAPVFFDGVNIIKNSGYNVATWNIYERFIHIRDDQLFSNEQELVFCHFSKISNEGQKSLERMLFNDSLFEELFYSYSHKLNSKIKDLSSLNLSEWAYKAHSLN